MKALNEQAFDHLKNMIIESKFSYQNFYSETQLAKEIGISRTPLRSALERLAHEGYIDIVPSKGFRIHQLTQKDVANTFQIRSAIESYCTLLISREFESRNAKKLFRDLDMIINAMEDVMNTTQDISKFSEYDFDFHGKIISYVDNDSISSVFDTYVYRMKKLAELSLSHKGRMEETCDEHRKILDAMRSGDTDHVYLITLEHMDNPRKINLDDLKDYAE